MSTHQRCVNGQRILMSKSHGIILATVAKRLTQRNVRPANLITNFGALRLVPFRCILRWKRRVGCDPKREAEHDFVGSHVPHLVHGWVCYRRPKVALPAPHHIFYGLRRALERVDMYYGQPTPRPRLPVERTLEDVEKLNSRGGRFMVT